MAGIVLAGGASTAHAQGTPQAAAYPSKPVRMIVGFPAGGGIDAVARIFAQHLAESFKQPFIVDNRAGASGNIGASQVAKAPADGHMLLMTADVHVITPAFSKELPFDPVKDFAAVGTVTSGPQCIAVHPSVPARSLPQLIALAKGQRQELAYASAGTGTLTHIAMELFRSMAGIKLLHVAYKGSGPSATAVVSGEVPIIFIALGLAQPHANAGRLRPLAVTTTKRTDLAPDIPTVAEFPGFSGYEASSWQGILAPAGTPRPIVSALNAEIERLLTRPDVREQLAARASIPNPLSPDAFAAKLAADHAKWTKVVRELGIQGE
jgi:tripartite-type tricarboxylate transporter receptor subunit TctC